MKPLVSIVIPTFNHGRYLREAIDSVLAQSYARIELIVVDDGSTDDTARVLESYRGRIRALRQANAGQSRALNHGWGLATGEILSYLGADDVLETHAAATAVDWLERHADSALVYCDYLLIDPASQVVRRVANGDFSYASMVSDLVCFPGPGVFFRKSAYLKAGGWDESLRQMPDFEYWLRLAREGGFVRIPDVLARYRVHEESNSFSRVGEDYAEEPVRIMTAFLESDRNPESVRKLRARSLANSHLLAARLHLRSGRARAAWTHARVALALFPRILLVPRTYRIVLSALVNRGVHKLLWRLNRLRGHPSR